MLVHRILEGPYEMKDGTWVFVTLCEDDDNNPLAHEITLESFDHAYKFESHFRTSVNPIVVEVDETTGYLKLHEEAALISTGEWN